MAEHKARILVVDDERFFREAIREILEAEDFECVECVGGEEALGLAKDASIGVVVLDIRLPGIDGIEVLRRLRELRSSLQVIMLSASTDQELVLEALRLGACDYLAKPLHDEELVLAVRRAASSYAVATDWRRLQNRLERLVERVEALGAAASIEQGTERDRVVWQGAADVAADVLEVRKTSLMLLSEDGRELRVAAAHGRVLSAAEMDAVRLGEGVAGAALQRAEAERVSDVRADPRYAGRAPEGRYESPSFAVAPLAVGAHRLGVLCVTDRRGGGDFGDEDLCLLRLLAMQISELLLGSAPARAAVADRAEADDTAAESRADDDEPSLDSEIARLICDAVVSEVEPQRVIRAVLEPLAASLAAAPVSLYLFDESGALVREGECDAGLRGDRPSLDSQRGLCGVVARTGGLVASAHPEADARFDEVVDTPADGKIGPLLCVPLSLRGQVVGLFRAFPQPGASVSARTGEVLAAALSAAVRNVLLYRSLVDSIEEVAEARREAQR